MKQTIYQGLNWPSFAYYLLLAIIFVAIGWFANVAYHLPQSKNNPISVIKPHLLEKYSIENLTNSNIEPSSIQIGKVITDDKDFTAYEFTFEFSPDLSKNLKKTTGLINIPKGSGPFPLIVMFRGYVDQKKYVIGMGTQHAGEFFAKNGFITVAPDFLGYGNSDLEAENIFESRFQTYVTAIALLKSTEALKDYPLKVETNYINTDHSNIFIWGHSNGGQIALTTLEITGLNYPTVLWTPVSKPFPFSILAYTDESDDHGKFIRRELSKFEEDYDVEKYSLTNYFDRIKAPIQLNQGTNDDAVPFYWSDSLIKILEKDGVDAKYLKYTGADHNLSPSWQKAVQNDLNFFNSHLK